MLTNQILNIIDNSRGTDDLHMKRSRQPLSNRVLASSNNGRPTGFLAAPTAKKTHRPARPRVASQARNSNTLHYVRLSVCLYRAHR